ncbi:MAG: nucleotidyltransferase domain-containing protein [Armatimonadota bacterium]|nr:nucleotidyltransferase domain-containing protein [Armatimonadota bacterium]
MGHRGVDRARLSRFLQALDERFPLERAIVFGSRARGDELLDSDYDLILVSPAFKGLPWPDRLRAVMDLWDLDVDLQPLCYTPDEFARKSAEISVVAEAVREGVAVI